MSKEQDIVDRLNYKTGKKRYDLVTSNAYDIPKRLKEYDSSMFVLYNYERGCFEVHSTDNHSMSTYCLTVPYNDLDERTLNIIRRGDMKTNGNKYLQSVLKDEERLLAKEEKERKEFTRDFAREHQSLFKKAKSDMGL